jgi:hypothetical protein
MRRPSLGVGLMLSTYAYFGCLTFSHVPLEKRKKLDSTTEKGILVGYSGSPRPIRSTFQH